MREGVRVPGDLSGIYPTDTHCLSPEGRRGYLLASLAQVVADGSGSTWGAGLITHLLLQLGESLYLLRTLGALCGKELLQSRAYLGGTGSVG